MHRQFSAPSLHIQAAQCRFEALAWLLQTSGLQQMRAALLQSLACPAVCLLHGHKLDSLQLPGHRTSDIQHARQCTVLSLGHRGGGWQFLKPYLRPWRLE